MDSLSQARDLFDQGSIMEKVKAIEAFTEIFQQEPTDKRTSSEIIQAGLYLVEWELVEMSQIKSKDGFDKHTNNIEKIMRRMSEFQDEKSWLAYRWFFSAMSFHFLKPEFLGEMYNPELNNPFQSEVQPEINIMYTAKYNSMKEALLEARRHASELENNKLFDKIDRELDRLELEINAAAMTKSNDKAKIDELQSYLREMRSKFEI